ncbi:hypothetical protein PVAND_017569 [Polypedilum vanderplanki]|uniref:Uncharacterized protein n=1 Tax=Polypedilum vanderplanki TaxID=319348 RepID=A0A9J6BJX3_POLVA|nr:hypothetical protein PVAND_017569 [Polypedilum vanderplanki]
MKVAIFIILSTIAITFACRPTQEAFEKCNNTPGMYFDTLKCQCLCKHPPISLPKSGHLHCNRPWHLNQDTKCCVCHERKCENPNHVFNIEKCQCECKDFLYCFIGNMDPNTCQCPNGPVTTKSTKPCVDKILCMNGCNWSQKLCECVCDGFMPIVPI